MRVCQYQTHPHFCINNYILENAFSFLLKRMWKQMAAIAKAKINPILIPAAPNFNGNAQSRPTDRPIKIYDTNAITIGTFTSVIPRSMAAPTACKPSAYWNKPANTISCEAIAITSLSSVKSIGI